MLSASLSSFKFRVPGQPCADEDTCTLIYFASELPAASKCRAWFDHGLINDFELHSLIVIHLRRPAYDVLKMK
jgi:hypothetical protein